VHYAETIRTFAEAFIVELRAMIGHCRALVPPQQDVGALAVPSFPAGDTSLLVGFNTRGSKPPFFCVHPSDGTVYCFVELARALGPDQPFYAIQAPGVDDGHDPFVDLQAMATCYVEQIRAVHPEGPYLIGGWSMGGVVAFEMAQQLTAKGQAIPLLAILDAGTHLHRRQRAMVKRMLSVAQNMPQRFSRAGVQQLGLGDQLEHLVSSARAADVELELDRLTGKILKVLSAHGQARIAYSPRPYGGKVTLFRADDQSFVENSQLSAPPSRVHRRRAALRGVKDRRWQPSRIERQNDPTMRWAAVSAGGVEIQAVPGDHLSMLKPPHVETLARALEQCLEQAVCDLAFAPLLSH
jgi:thioesterase domain-containing protein